MVKPRRAQVSLSADLERKLILWASLRDETLSGWMKTILRLRADENWPKVKISLEEKAERLGMTREELEQKILTKAGFDFEREMAELNDDDKNESD
jgi:hypothetical protein